MLKKDKDFNKMMHDNKDMPKIKEVTDENTIKRNGGNKMLLAPALFYDELMKRIPSGELCTISMMRDHLAK